MTDENNPSTDFANIDPEPQTTYGTGWLQLELLGGGEVERYLTFHIQSNDEPEMYLTASAGDGDYSVNFNADPGSDASYSIAIPADGPEGAETLRELSELASLAADYLEESDDE